MGAADSSVGVGEPGAAVAGAGSVVGVGELEPGADGVELVGAGVPVGVVGFEVAASGNVSVAVASFIGFDASRVSVSRVSVEQDNAAQSERPKRVGERR